MNDKKPDNPQAFARSFSSYIDQADGIQRVVHEQKGMTLRDYFAGKAINPAIINLIRKMKYGADSEHQKRTPIDYYNIAEESYRIADAMLKAREEK